MILDSGLLFWASLYTYYTGVTKRSVPQTRVYRAAWQNHTILLFYIELCPTKIK